MFDIIIVGAGPAGLSAAIYAKRSGKNVLILEAKTYGGQIINTPNIENYPAIENISGFEFAQNLYNQAKNLGATIKFEKVTMINNYDEYKEVITTSNSYKAKVIILATGTENRKLKIDNEDKLTGRGVSYCATCDGNFYKNKVVAVNGGGNTALEDAIYLSNLASKVYLIHRRDSFKAEQKLVTEAKSKDNIEFILDSVITNINGDDKLNSITIKNKHNSERDINIDGLFIAIGQIPENENFKNLINIDDNGYIIGNERCETNIAGIFVAGDNRKKELRQLVTAVNDGAIAATNAVTYIK